MRWQLPGPIEAAVQPLWQALPLERALGVLVVQRPLSEHAALVESIVKQPAIASKPPLCAGLWLYVDELDRSHKISQGIEDATGAFWHGIMHRREGDFSNSHYWFRRVDAHPALAVMGQDYDPHRFIDEVEAAHKQGANPQDLIDRQRREWATLFQWCAGGPH